MTCHYAAFAIYLYIVIYCFISYAREHSIVWNVKLRGNALLKMHCAYVLTYKIKRVPGVTCLTWDLTLIIGAY